jgi:hypothetical protein
MRKSREDGAEANIDNRSKLLSYSSKEKKFQNFKCFSLTVQIFKRPAKEMSNMQIF